MIIFWLPSALALCFIAFGLSLKSSIERAVLYGAARQALGEGAAVADGPPYRQDVESRQRGLWLSFKAYAPTCALLLLTGALQFQKFPLMSAAISSREIHTVKALQATGVPLPFWLPADRPTSIRRWLYRADIYQRHIFQPYGPSIIQSHAMTKFLLEKGVDVNTRLVLNRTWTPPGISAVSMTPLQVALTGGRVDIARMMIAHGADVHARDSIGRSPLIVAINYCPSAIELLLASGVDINEQTRFGAPLLAAARYQWLYSEERRTRESENAVKILLEKGADPNTRDSDGRNALMVMSMELRPAASRGVRRGVLGRGVLDGVRNGVIFVEDGNPVQLIGESLLQAGCDVNAVDSIGRTPLMYAVHYNRPTAVRLLLEGGADIKARDNKGMTALDLVRNLDDQQEVFKLLKSAGVQPGNAKNPGASPVKPAE